MPYSDHAKTVQHRARACGRCARRFRLGPVLPARIRSLRAASIFPTSPLIEQEGEVGNKFGSATRALAQAGGVPIRKRTDGELTVIMTEEMQI
jgi:hypothetical protein